MKYWNVQIHVSSKQKNSVLTGTELTPWKSREANSQLASQEIPSFIESEDSLPCS
jgi:hypothetical protein